MASITELVSKIRNAILGKDVRESIAASIEQCYEDASKNGNANMEVSEARGSFDTLSKRLNNSDDIKADKENLNTEIELRKSSDNNLKNQANNLQSQIDSLASGSPQVANSIEEMTDITRVYVNTADGHWYTYNGTAWVDGGVYQSTSFPELTDIRTAFDGTDYDSAGDSVRNQVKGIYDFIIKSILQNKYIFVIPVVEGVQLAKDYNLSLVEGQTLNFEFNFNNVLNEDKINVIFYDKNDEQIDSFSYNGSTSIHTLEGGNATKIRFYCSSENVATTGEINCTLILNDDALLTTNHEINFKNVLKSLFDYNLSIKGDIKTNTTYSKSSPIFIPKNTKAKFLFTSDAVKENTNMALGFNYDTGYVNNVATISVNKEQEILITDNILDIVCYISGDNINTDGSFSLDISLFEDGVIQKVQSLDSQLKKLKNKLNISILGDSISSYEGWNPNGYTPWYSDAGNYNESNDINDVKQTWWYKIIEELKATLLVNSSYSGTTICNTGYDGNDSSEHSFITRMKNDIGEGKVLQAKPNLIFVFGGTNDTWASSPVGSLKYSDWTDEDLKRTLPAFCYMINYLKKLNPGCRMINIINTSVSDEIRQGMINACEYYSVENIVLENISVTGGHPNQEGMNEIANQILQYLSKNTESEN